MTVSVHNPDQYMASLRQIIAQGRKRIGLLVGAGAPAGIFPPGSDKPLIPAVAGLTDMVMEALKADYGKTLDAVRAELETPNIETILSRVRSLAGVIGKTKVHDLDGEGYKKLSEEICEQIANIQDVESSELAAELLRRATHSHPLGQRPRVLHSDNGGAMKGATMLATMQTLGVVPSFSRPRVSDDNACAEALFRTGKYCALWPRRPFASLEDAREWVLRFTRWYNQEHRHSALRFVTPAQRHWGQAPAILELRKAVYEMARQRHPRRWSRDIRNWNIEPVVWLNRQKATTATTLAIAA